MKVWIFDIDGVLQDPIYPHPQLFLDVSRVLGIPYETLHQHYTGKFAGNSLEEEYHFSLCQGDEEKIQRVREFWKRLRDTTEESNLVSGAKELLGLVTDFGDQIFAWTKGKNTEDLQRRRLGNVGLADFFPEGRIIASPRKGTIEGLDLDLIPHLPQGGKILVGDSFDQDIRPALGREHFTCVWIKNSTVYRGVSRPKVEVKNRPNLIIVDDTQELANLVRKGELK